MDDVPGQISITLGDIYLVPAQRVGTLELAKESGVDIPTLCHDPQLSTLGACRVCLVEDE
ncbi:MAG: 2Fe-2S iron-sulfur cluster-binding protein, partial [Desulfovermiculus sp.]